jgi:hypothetical protein
MSDTDEVNGVFDAIDNEVTAHDPVEEVSTEPVAEGAENGSAAPEAEETTPPAEVEKPSEAAPVEGQAETEASTTEAHSQTEESTEAEVDNWQETLPPPPQPYQGPQPEFDPETGTITNMTPAEYSRYMTEVAKAEMRQELYTSTVENRALDVAEQILPELKTNPAIRTMVENARVASIISGQQIDTVEAAKQVRDALGIAPERIKAAQAEGAQNAKASITVAKNAALETPSNAVPTEDTGAELIKRINRGDDEAFAELLGQWEETGKI